MLAGMKLVRVRRLTAFLLLVVASATLLGCADGGCRSGSCGLPSLGPATYGVSPYQGRYIEGGHGWR